jgi:hypothetical protein
MASKKKIISKTENLMNWKLLLLVIVSFLAFIPSLNNDFVNWDDIVYIMNNDMITSFSWINLQKIFSTYFMGNYHPFILLSFSFDYNLFKLSPHGYHVHNLLLHIINTFLVYTFFFHLLKKNVNVAVTIALLFAIHPMHVESVAWVSERKDLLYTAYFFLSLIAYLLYLQRGKASLYFLAILLFTFSLLSKAQAVTLPLVLFLVDYFLNRKFDWKTFLEKVPFLILSLLFGVVAIFAQQSNNFINPSGIPISDSLFYAPYGLFIYLIKFLLPFYQTAIYTYPITPAGTIPLYVYFSPIVIILFIAAIWKTWRSERYITFGLLFFLATIFPVLQFLPVGPALVAERYSYIPYIGLATIFAIAFWKMRPALAAQTRKITDIVAVLLIILFTILTWNRNLVWKDSVTLWTDVMNKNPECIDAYINRAFIYNEHKQYEEALKDLSDGLLVDSTNFSMYKSKGIIYERTGKYDLALSNFSKAIRYKPEEVKTYLLRGILYTDKFAKYDSGIADFKKYLTRYPDDINATFNLGVANYNKGNYDTARSYCLKVLKLNPGNEGALNLLNNMEKLKP